MEGVTKELFNAQFDSLKELINQKFKTNEAQHKAIDIKVSKTNGKVAEQEKKIADQEKEIRKNTAWRKGLIMLWGAATITLPILAYYYTKSLYSDVEHQIVQIITKMLEAKGL